MLLAFLHSAAELGTGLAFLVFVVLAVRAGEGASAPEVLPTRRVRAFILVAVAWSFGPGLVQHDAWPFSSWAMANTVVSPDATILRPVVVDDAGGVYPVDYRAFEPLDWGVLGTWFDEVAEDDPDVARSMGVWVIQRLNRAREDALQGRGVGPDARIWGRLSAPLPMVTRPLWTTESAPPRPFVAFRIERATMEGRQAVFFETHVD